MKMLKRSFTDEEIEIIDRKFENLKTFIEDVIEDPSVLERIPDQSNIELTPIAEKDPGRSYMAETRRLAINATPTPVSSKNNNLR